MTIADRPRTFPLRTLAARFAALVLAAGQLNAAFATCPADAIPGANVAGGEFNAGAEPGRYGYEYVYPSQTEADVVKKLQLRLMRVPVLWERLQHTALGTLDEDEMKRIDAVVDLATSNGLMIAIDVHNYGSYRGVALGSTNAPAGALADLWRRLATRYRSRANVQFGMMNEPNGIPTEVWATLARQTLAAIRATGATNVVFVPGTNWDGAHSWFSKVGNLSNAEALLPLAHGDPQVVFEVHQYFDSNFSGTSDTCTGSETSLAALQSMGTWARSNHVKLFLGEFGASQRPECLTTLDSAMAILEQDKDVWYGWTYWAAGAWWGDYMFNLQSTSGQAAQGGILKTRATTLNNVVCRPSAANPPTTSNPPAAPAPAPVPAPAPAPAPQPVVQPKPGKLSTLWYFLQKLFGGQKTG